VGPRKEGRKEGGERGCPIRQETFLGGLKEWIKMWGSQNYLTSQRECAKRKQKKESKRIVLMAREILSGEGEEGFQKREKLRDGSQQN